MWFIKKYETDVNSSEEPPILIYPNKIRNMIVFKMETGDKLQMLENETRALLGDGTIVDTNKKVHSVLLHCNVIDNNYLQNSKLLYKFVPNNDFGQLFSVQPQ